MPLFSGILLIKADIGAVCVREFSHMPIVTLLCMVSLLSGIILKVGIGAVHVRAFSLSPLIYVFCFIFLKLERPMCRVVDK